MELEKRCYTCKEYKSFESFPNDRDKRDGKSSYCYDCKREQEFAYRQKHKIHRALQYKVRRKRIVVENRKKIIEYFSVHPCMDCGETDIVVLEFDHKKDKKYSIAQMIMNGLSWEKILEEIQKCEVVCSNDHARRTAKQQSWWKYAG